MTPASALSGARRASDLSRHGNHQDSAKTPPHTRVRPRRYRLLLAGVFAIAVLYSGFHLLRGRDGVVQGSSTPQHAPFSPYEVIFKGDGQGQPTPLAPHDPRDLLRWQMTAGPAAPNNANSTDDPVRVHLYLSGQIALIPPGTRASVLQEKGQWQFVRILNGRHQGLTGYINRPDVKLPAHA